MLSYEKLLVYQSSMRFLRFSRNLISSLPRGSSPISDQLRRASISIPLNIAEACGKTKTPDKRKYFAHARGSAMECAAILDVCYEYKFLSHTDYKQNKELLRSIIAMLSKLSRHANFMREQEQDQDQKQG